MEDIEPDGRICDSASDPPEQRRAYIPPGDETHERYRLSTFLKFPEEALVDQVDLSAKGFLYTGYKDRVRCFCCNETVEDWQLGDDVASPRWHKGDCKMMLNEECGNVSFRSVRPYQDWRPSSDLNQHHQTMKLQLAQIYSFSHERFVKSLNLHKEVDRMKTFTAWPAEPAHIKPEDLAQSGFFYLGNLDRVQCFSCGIVLKDWKTGDVVDSEHKRFISNCRMINRTDPRNIPQPTDEPLFIARPPPPSSELDYSEMPQQGPYHGVFSCQNPINIHLRNEDVRLETFDSRWPLQSINATPKQLAEAGFYFLGERDRAKCWYCNGGLLNWKRDDEPWTEHAKWYPTCEFLLQHKGPAFVLDIVSKYPNLRRPSLRNGYNGPLLSGLGVRSSQSFPPAIIDPNADLHEKVRQAMELPIAKNAIEMGYTRKYVKKIIKMKLQHEEMYNDISDLVEDLASDSSDEDHDHPLNRQPPTEEIDNALQRIRNMEETAQNMEARAQRSENRTQSLESDLQTLEDERRCKICLDRNADTVFVPCGHLCCCRTCAVAIERCPMCRNNIQECIRVFL